MSDSPLKLLYLKSGSLKVENQQNCIDHSDTVHHHKSYYQPHTRGWFVDQVEIRLCPDEHLTDEKNAVMWMNGNAGMGKSVIAAILLDKYMKRDMLGAWHFCTHSNASQNTVLAIILSLSGMLEVTIPGYVEALHSQGDATLQEAKSNEDPIELFNVFFVIPLSTVDPPTDSNGVPKKMIIICDAVDEMKEKEMSGFLKILRDAASELPSFLLLFVTSRRDDNILSALSEKHKPIELRVDSSNQQNDILVLLYQIARQYGNIVFSWEDMERELELKFNLPKGSLKRKLQQLEAPLVASKREYDKVIDAQRISDSSFDEMVDSIRIMKAKKSELLQPSSNLNTTYDQAGVVKEVMGERLVARFGDDAVIPGLKKRADAERKIKDKYFGKANRIKDIFRSSVKFNSFRELLNGLNFLLEMKGMKILNIKNKFKDRDVLGYADININAGFKLDDGTYHIFEIQLHLKPILVVKEEIHDFYGIIRTTIPTIVGDLTVDQTNQMKEYIIGRLRNSTMDFIIDILLEKSGGVFLFARLLKESLAELARKHPGTKLDFSNLTAIPEGLDQFYRENMKRIIAEGASDEFQINCFRFMSLICAAQEPLPQTMVQNIMGEDAFCRVKGKLSLLFPAGAGERINIVHKSLIDWLLRNIDDEEKTDSGIVDYFVSRKDLKLAHRSLFAMCQKSFDCVTNASCVTNTDNGKYKTNNCFNLLSFFVRLTRSSNEGDCADMKYSSEGRNDENFESTAVDLADYAWKYSVVHVCEGGENGQLDAARNDQLLDFGWQVRKINTVGMVEVIRDGQRYLRLRPNDRPVHLITQAQQLSAPAVEKDPREYSSQLLGGRLTMIYESELFPEIVKVRETAEHYCLSQGNGGEEGKVADSTTVSLWKPVTRNLTGAGHPCQKVLSGHSGWVNAVKLTKEGDRILSGSEDGSIKLWNVESGKCDLTMMGHDGWVSAVDISNDGLVMFSGGDDNTVRSWDAQTGVLRLTMEGHTGRVMAVRAAPDGKKVCSGSRDKTVRLWDASTGVELKCFTGHTKQVSSVDMTLDGSIIVSGSEDQTIRLWNVASGESRVIKGHTRVYAVCLSSDEKSIFSGSQDKSVKMWDVSSGELVRSFEGDSLTVLSVCVTSDGKWMISGSRDNTIRKWNIESGECVNVLKGHTNWVRSVSSHNNIVCSGSMDGTVRIWDSNAKVTHELTEWHESEVYSVMFNATGTRLVSKSYNDVYCVWDCETGECIYKSEDEPPQDVFNRDTAREECWVYNMEDMFDENEVGFSTDGNLTPKVHFYADNDGRRLKACVMDDNIIHILRRV